MASIGSIVKNNNATFYNYRDGGKVRIWPRVLFFAAISPALAFLLTDNLTDFVNSINTVASILLGFAFSVLFYIASSKEEAHNSDASLESMNRIRRLNALSKELFHNVSYFVMTASAGLAFSMIVIAPDSQSQWFVTQALPYLEKLTSRASDIVWWVGLCFRSVFFFFMIEASFTFGRIVNRVNFLFEEKLKNNS